MAVSWLNSGIGGSTGGQASNPFTTGGYLDPQQWQTLPAYAQNNANGYTLYRNNQTGQTRGSKGTVGSQDFSLADFAGNQPQLPAAPQALQAPAAPAASSGMDLSSLLNAFNQAPATGGANPQYTSGINAGPVYSAGQQADATRAVAHNQANIPGVYGVEPNAGQSAGMGTQIGNLMRQFGQRNANTLDRGMSNANAQQLLASQTARAQSGVSGGNILQGLYDQNLRFQTAQTQPLLALLSQLLG